MGDLLNLVKINRRVVILRIKNLSLQEQWKLFSHLANICLHGEEEAIKLALRELLQIGSKYRCKGSLRLNFNYYSTGQYI